MELTCDYCDYKTTRKSWLLRHRRKHTGEKPFQCELCDYEASHKASLMKHYKKKHPTATVVDTIKCNHHDCDLFKETYILADQLKDIDQAENQSDQMIFETLKSNSSSRKAPSKFSCKCCGYQTSQKTLFLHHNKIHSVQKLYQCNNVCDKVSDNSNFLKHKIKHINQSTDSFFLDNEQSSKVKTLISNSNVPIIKRIFDCLYCDYQTSQKSWLRRHQKVHSGDKPYLCTICKCDFSYKSSLITHLKRHKDEIAVRFNVDNSESSQDESLTFYTKGLTSESYFQCIYCDYQTTQKSWLIRHRRVHTKEKPYHCNLCEYKASHKSSLLKHRMKHTDQVAENENHNLLLEYSDHFSSQYTTKQKSFLCQHCDFQTSNKSLLLNHQMEHVADAIFFCDLCEYNARDELSVIEHRKRHSFQSIVNPEMYEKRFQCIHCNYWAKQKSWLRRHHRIHTNKKLFHCDLCDFRANHKSSVLIHRKKHLDERKDIIKRNNREGNNFDKRNNSDERNNLDKRNNLD